MAVRSKRLGAMVAGATGTHTLYVCPTGYRTIVKSLLLQNLASSAQRLVVQVAIYAGGTFQFVVHMAAVNAAGESLDYETWIVLEEGDSLQVYVSTGTASAYASGAELLVSA